MSFIERRAIMFVRLERAIERAKMDTEIRNQLSMALYVLIRVAENQNDQMRAEFGTYGIKCIRDLVNGLTEET